MGTDLERADRVKVLEILAAVGDLLDVQPVEEDTSCCVFCGECVGYYLGDHRASCPWERLRVAYRERLVCQ